MNDKHTGKLLFDIDRLDNLRSLHEHEEQLRSESLKFIASDDRCSELVFLLANAMNVIFGFVHDHKHANHDELTIKFLGIRLFNLAGASLKLALSGYAQQAMAHARDILEVAFLIDYFRTNPNQISIWKAASSKERRKKFAPIHFGEALDARDGNQEKKRQKAYDSLCEYAAHATYDGFLLTIKEGSPQLGPFFDERILLAWLSEMALRFVPAAAQFGALFSNLDRTLLDMQHKFANHVLAWQARNSGSAAAKQSPAAPN